MDVIVLSIYTWNVSGKVLSAFTVGTKQQVFREGKNLNHTAVLWTEPEVSNLGFTAQSTSTVNIRARTRGIRREKTYIILQVCEVP